MPKMKKLTHDMVHEMVQRNLNPDKGNGTQPDALRTLIDRAKVRNRQFLNRRVK